MANIPVDEAPNLNLDMENFTDKTPVHFDEMNSRHKQHLNNEKALLYPTFDDSGTASGILSFTDFLATVKNRMRLFDFFKNFKTGMQFVMHLGKAANNCTTTATGLYLDARQGKVLMDLYTKLNSDLEQRYALVGGNDIPANTDLNNLMTISNYRCSTNSTATTFKNCPTAGAFTLKVVGGTGWDSYQQQFLCAYDGATYFRWYNTFGSPPAWSAWKKLY